jgi:tetratricopeptide (TPR) repeat protein
LTEHPSAEELLDLVRGRIAPQRGGEVLRHLYEGCEKCLAAAPVGLAAGLGVERDLTAKEEAATESAIDRAFAAALREDRKLSRRQGQLEKTVKNVVAGGFGGPERLPRWMKPVDKIETLLASSWSVRFENVALMVYFAQLAVSCAEQLETPRHGGKGVFDIRCRALAELGNAYRASDQFDKAGEAFARSRQLFELGTCPDSLEIRLLELEASFDAYSRSFGNACLRLKKVFSFYRRNGQDHFAGRTLLQLGRYTGFAGDFEKALRLIDESLSLLDVNKDAGLVYVAKQNQIEFLVWCKRYRDAEIELFHLRALQRATGGRINELRQHWLAGRIEAGKERLARAETTLREVHEGWTELGSGYNVALVSLDLAAVLLAQRKAPEATTVVSAAYKIFSALNIQREALVVLLMLKTSCEMREATREHVEKLARYLRKLENDPKAEFEA